jgi:hypothetical protein
LGAVSDVPTYLDQRLPSIAEEGLNAAKIAVTKITSVAAGAGQLGNSRLWFQYDEAIQREYVNALNKAAGLIAAIAGAAAPQYAGQLDKFASELVDQIIEWVEQRRQSASAFNESGLLNAHVARVRDALSKARASIVGDFGFGVVEGKQMASSPVQNAVTIQNVSDSIITVVQTGHLSGKYEKFAWQLADVLKSAEIEQLPTEKKEEVAALAETVKDELGNPSPDQGKVLRRATLLVKALGRFGANTASATIGKLIADCLQSG